MLIDFWLRCLTGPGLALLVAVTSLQGKDSVAPADSGLERWAEAWPVEAPLDVEWLDTSTQDGIEIRHLRFTGSVIEGRPQRVYALYAAPVPSRADETFPAVLQIHGGGQTCEPANVVWYVKRGYACLSFDWGGPRDGRSPEETTVWEPPILVDYIDQPPGGVGELFLFHAVLAARRAIDLLQEQDEVDGDRIGVQGISWGGLLTWVVGAVDNRVKVLVPVYGAGGLDSGESGEGAALLRRGADWVRVWTETFDPRLVSSAISAPTLFCNGTDDWFGTLKASEKAVEGLSGPRARSYSANRNHSLEYGNVRAIETWLDLHLKAGAGRMPAAPEMELAASANGRLTARVRAPGADGVSLRVARGGLAGPLKCWLEVPARRIDGDNWMVEVPVWKVDEPLSILAQVRSKDGALLTSKVVIDLLPSPIEGVLPGGSEPVAGGMIAGEGDTTAWFVETNTDFYFTEENSGKLRAVKLDARTGVRPVRAGGAVLPMMTTRRPADPAVRPVDGAELLIWTHDLASVDVLLNEKSKRYLGVEGWRVKIRPGAGWVRTVLSPKDFSTDGAAADFFGVYEIGLSGESVEQGMGAVGEVRWLVPKRQ